MLVVRQPAIVERRRQPRLEQRQQRDADHQQAIAPRPFDDGDDRHQPGGEQQVGQGEAGEGVGFFLAIALGRRGADPPHAEHRGAPHQEHAEAAERERGEHGRIAVRAETAIEERQHDQHQQHAGQASQHVGADRPNQLAPFGIGEQRAHSHGSSIAPPVAPGRRAGSRTA